MSDTDSTSSSNSSINSLYFEDNETNETNETKIIAWPPIFTQNQAHNAQELEHSNMIILSEDILYKFTQEEKNNTTDDQEEESMFPLTFRITNPETKISTIAQVLDFTALPGTCIIPYHIMQNLMLQEGSHITIKYEKILDGDYIKLKFHESSFSKLPNAKKILEQNLSKYYPTLTKNETVAIQHENKTYFIDIIDTKPVETIKITNKNINVDVDKPYDYVEPEPQAAAPQQPAPPAAPITAHTTAHTTAPHTNQIINHHSINQTNQTTNNNPRSLSNFSNLNKKFVPFSGKGYVLGSK